MLVVQTSGPFLNKVKAANIRIEVDISFSFATDRIHPRKEQFAPLRQYIVLSYVGILGENSDLQHCSTK